MIELHAQYSTCLQASFFDSSQQDSSGFNMHDVVPDILKRLSLISEIFVRILLPSLSVTIIQNVVA